MLAIGMAAVARLEPDEGDIVIKNRGTSKDDGQVQMISYSTTEVAGAPAVAKAQPVEGDAGLANTANDDGQAQVTSKGDNELDNTENDDGQAQVTSNSNTAVV